MSAFGELVRSNRRRVRMTQEELANASGISTRTITDIERGRVTRPHDRTVRLLANALRLTSDVRDKLEAAAREEYWAAQESRGESTAVPAASERRVMMPRALPRTLPRPPSPFVGRDACLARLTDVVAASPGAPLAITGKAGVGKTALAVAFAHKIGPGYPDGQLFIDLHNGDPERPAAEPLEVLRHVLTMIEGPASVPPRAFDDALARYRSHLAGSRTLVLVDNAASSAQVRPLLPGDAGCTVLVTSRHRLDGLVAGDGARIFPLDVLAPAAATSLICELSGMQDAIATADLARLAARCGYLPRALRIVATRLGRAPASAVDSVLSDLSASSGRADAKRHA